MRYSKTLMALGVAFAVAYATYAYAAGLWPGYQIVGSAAFCSSTNTAGVPGTSSVCTTTTPAGPTIVTGLETIPADTNAAGGVQPQTVRLTLASLNAQPFTYNTISILGATNNYMSASAVDGGIIVVTSAALTGTTTVLLPSSPIDGQQFGLSSTQNINSLTMSGGTTTVSNTPTALTVATTGGPYGYTFRYRTSNTTWYRTQ